MIYNNNDSDVKIHRTRLQQKRRARTKAAKQARKIQRGK